eukprot:3167105-Prymnesium_polylepis.1
MTLFYLILIPLENADVHVSFQGAELGGDYFFVCGKRRIASTARVEAWCPVSGVRGRRAASLHVYVGGSDLTKSDVLPDNRVAAPRSAASVHG